ncbi:MAG: hypothetical protein LUB59_04815, partial [Candidatus Gastranaerophilales bacterium]|nr:hypothetical protein [Candidatus Gastranaerophilales bacterium]
VLRNMKSEDADRILDGEADLNQVMKFIETNKKLPEGSKDLILGIYGIGQKSKYYYDKDKKIITSQPANSSNSSGSSSLNGSDVKLSAYGKAAVAENLESDLHNLISFASADENVINKKNIKTPQQAAEAQSYSIGVMQRAAMLQGQIDSAYAAKSIDKSTRKKYMNSYIAPVVDYVEKNLSQLDEKSGVKGVVGQKLGYGMIKQHYPTKGLKGEQLREVQRQKLFAQNYYLDELNKVKSKYNMNSIYDIENLSSQQQREIYKTASENALKRAKRWTDRPEYYFAKEYPQAYAAPFLMLGQKQALEINRTVAAEVYKKEYENNGVSGLELDDYANKRISREIQQQVNRNKYKAGIMLSRDMEISAPDPKTYWELEKRLKAMGYTIDEFAKFAAKQGYVSSRFNGWDWRKGYMSQGHIQAYRDLRRAAAGVTK